jgi:glyoxylase-like metal-dependent hydrolase (beta-lactamase superfamily II)
MAATRSIYQTVFSCPCACDKLAPMKARSFLAGFLFVSAFTSVAIGAIEVVRTGDPAKRGLKPEDLPRAVRVAENVYTWEGYHPGSDIFTTTDMFVVTREGVLVADGQASPAETRGLVNAIAKITPQPIRYVVICSDHSDHTGGNSAFPPGVKWIVHPAATATLDAQATAPNGTGYPGEYVSTLDKAEKLDARTFIPGHGFTGEADVSREELHTFHVEVQYVAVRRVYDELNGKLK